MARPKNKVTILKESKVVLPVNQPAGFLEDEDPTDPDNVQLPPDLAFESAVEAVIRQIKDWKDPGTRQPAHVRINQQGKPTIR